MKKHLLPIILFLNCITLAAQRKELLNFDWKFYPGDIENAQSATFTDAKWQTVQLPHDAGIYGPFAKDMQGGSKRNGYRARGIGWYRKHLTIGKLDSSKEYILEFEGVYRAARVWVNGLYCGEFLNGHLDFEYNITGKLKTGSNIIAVRYDNTFTESARWYTGEGINRSVYLHTKNKLHVSRYGTYITTPYITREKARAVIETQVAKTIRDSVFCRIVTEIMDPSGHKIASKTSMAPITIGDTHTFRTELDIPDPHLWDLESPHLYKAVCSIYNGSELADTFETPFGIRTVEFTAEEGFLLNGKKVFLKGVCLHEDLGPLGTAAFEAGWERRLTILKTELGCNAVRLSHNPYPKYVLDWCDKNGILVYDEAFDTWTEQFYGPGADFKKHWKADLETFIRRDRNHPSVFIWSMGNEVKQQQEGIDNYGVTQLAEMVAFTRQLEPSRKVTAALFPSRWNSEKLWKNGKFVGTAYKMPAQMAFYMDIMSVNYMEKFFAGDRERFPQLIPLVSEISTGKRGEAYFDYDHSTAAGQFYWGGTDYLGESFGWPAKGWNKGIIDLSGDLKPIGYSIKSFYDEKPVVYASVLPQKEDQAKIWNDNKIVWQGSSPHWNWRGLASVKVQIFSNCQQVELVLNGRSLGISTMPENAQNNLILDIPYQEGELKVIGINNGKTAAEQVLKTAQKAYKIILEADKDSLAADGSDLAYLTAKVTDADGTVVPTSEFTIKFQVSANASIAGVGNGDIDSGELFQAGQRSVFNGRCQLIIRSSLKSGTIKIAASSPGLKSSELQIISKK